VSDARPPAPYVDPDARERVVDALTRAFADDRISDEDLEARLERVYHAQSGAELEAIVADLPSRAPARGDAATPVATGTPRRIAALLSGQEQRMMGVVPRELEVRARLGYVELNLTKATFEPGETVIDVRAFMGYVQIRFPDGVRVECEGGALFGFFALAGGATADTAPATPLVRVVGRATFGFAELFALRREPPRLPGGGPPRLPAAGR